MLHYAARFRKQQFHSADEPHGLWRLRQITASPVLFPLSLALTVLLAFGLTLLLATVARHAVLDSTLDFFVRENPFPPPLVLLIICTLLLCTLAVVLLIVGLAWGVMGRLASRVQAVAWPAWALTTLIWHWPPAYEAALRSRGWHDLEHATFLAAALLFWYPVVSPWPERQGPRPARKLKACLLDVVAVEVYVAERVDEIAWF